MSASSLETGEGSVSAEATPHPPSLQRRHLLPQGEKGSERIARTAPRLPAHYSPHLTRLLATHACTPPRLETIVVKHPRLCIHRAAAFLRDHVDRRRHLDLGLRGLRGRPSQR